jgi:hypothetical protein
MRPSGTLQSPTTGSLEAMLRGRIAKISGRMGLQQKTQPLKRARLPRLVRWRTAAGSTNGSWPNVNQTNNTVANRCQLTQGARGPNAAGSNLRHCAYSSGRCASFTNNTHAD